jgi:truncated hemoglobin YjbI
MDKIENKDIRNKTKVTEMHRKIQEKRLRWYGHLQRREEEFVTKRVLKMEVEGKRASGRPRRRWMECIKEDMAEKKLKTQDSANRPHWRTLKKNANPT